MQGLEMRREGDKLILEIDMTKGKESSTGKTVIRCSTRGFQWSEDGDFAVKMIVIEMVKP